MHVPAVRSIAILLVALPLAALSGPLAAGATPCPTPPRPPASAVLMTEQARTELFEAVWAAVDARSVDPSGHGADWAAVRAAFAPRIDAAATEGEVEAILSEMVGRLGQGEARLEWRPEPVDATASFTGIGIVADRFATDEEVGLGIAYVMPGGPADRAGVRERDRILAVDGATCPSVETLRGPAGTPVELVVRSPGRSPRVLTVERGVVEPSFLPDARLLTTGDGRRVGYLRMPSLEPPDSAATVETALEGLVGIGRTEGVVLDLRAVGGTDLAIADAIAGQFRSGELAVVQGRSTSEPWVTAPGRLLPQLADVPLVVLIDGATEGSPEMLAGLLHAGGRATTVGSATAGTGGRLSEAIPMPGGRILWLVTRQVLLADGTPIAPVPVDLPVTAGWTDEPSAADSAIAAAMTSLGCHGD